jgi:hypothetical protein
LVLVFSAAAREERSSGGRLRRLGEGGEGGVREGVEEEREIEK